jgi:hypothetical protein
MRKTYLIGLAAIVLSFILYNHLGGETYCSKDDFQDSCCKGICIESWQGAFPRLEGAANITLPARGTVDIVSKGQDLLYLDGKKYWNPSWDTYGLIGEYGSYEVYAASPDTVYIDGEDIDDFILSNNATYSFFGMPDRAERIEPYSDFLVMNTSYIGRNGKTGKSFELSSSDTEFESIRLKKERPDWLIIIVAASFLSFVGWELYRLRR